MHVLVAYDISNNKSRTKLYKYLKDRGLHSQKSVFECDMQPDDIKKVYNYAKGLMEENDSLVIYRLCKRCSKKACILGQGIFLVQQDWVII